MPRRSSNLLFSFKTHVFHQRRPLRYFLNLISKSFYFMILDIFRNTFNLTRYHVIYLFYVLVFTRKDNEIFYSKNMYM